MRPNRIPDDLQLQAPPAVLAPGASGLSVLGIEVTQAVQDMQNSVVLVAGKTTVVRMYLEARSLAQGTATIVDGELAWRRGNTAEAYLPSFSTVSLVADRPRALTEQRHQVWSSLNFRLPAEAIAAGELTLRLNRLMVVGGDDVPIAGVSQATIDFLATPPLVVRVIGFRYFVPSLFEGVPPTVVSPDAFHFAHLRSYLERAYPVASVQWSHVVVDANFAPPFDNDFTHGDKTTAIQANAQLTSIRSREVGVQFDSESGLLIVGHDPRTHYYGLVADNSAQDFMVGFGYYVPGQPRPDMPAVGPAGAPSPRFPWDMDASYADWYGAHEIGHTFGRLHAGFPPQQQPSKDPDFPYPNGQISTDDDRYVGFDVGDANLNLPMQALPGRIYHDVMTYGEKQWLSAYTYEGIRKRLLEEASLFAIDPFSMREMPGSLREIDDNDLADAPANVLTSRSDRADRRQPRLAQGQFVHVVALVNLQAGTGEILYVHPATAAIEGLASNDHGVELQFNDAAGQLLFSRQPQVSINTCEDAAAPRTGLINEDVPFIQGMNEVLLLVNGQVQSRHVAGDIDLPANAEVTMGGPQPGRSHRRMLTGPPEARRSGVTYTVQGRSTGDTIWQTIAVGRSTPDIEVNLNQFPSAEKVAVRVLMTNGFEDRILAEHEIVVGNLGE